MEPSSSVLAPAFTAADAEELLGLFSDPESFFGEDMTSSLPASSRLEAASPILQAAPAFQLNDPGVQFDAAARPGNTGLDVNDSNSLGKRSEKPKKKSTFQRQKEEIHYLQTKVVDLQARVRALRGMDRPTAALPEPSELEQSLRQVATSLSRWQKEAKRQQTERSRTERENVELRKLTKEHAGLAKSLKRMLRRRMVFFADLQASNKHEQRYHQEISEQDSQVFQVLRHSIDNRMKNVDTLFEAHGLTPKTTNLNTTRVVSNDNQDDEVEFVSAKLLAVDFRLLSATIWNLLNAKHEGQDEFYETKLADRTVCTKQITQSNPNDSTSGSMVIFSVFKQVAQEDRLLLYWERLIERNGREGSGIPVAYLSQHGCGQTIRMDDPNRGGASVSLTQSYVHIKPSQMTSHVQKQHNTSQPTKPAASMDTLITSYQQSRQRFLHGVEHALEGLVTEISNVRL